MILNADAAGIAHAARCIVEGKLVAFGTETVYGLGADATNDTAVAAVFAAKRRPHFNPLICHFPDGESAWDHVAPSNDARRLAECLWPGPLTLVLPRRPRASISLLAGAGLDSLAVRVPAHPTALALLRACGTPVAAPSANISGQVSPTTAAHVLDGLEGRVDAVLDCGPCPVGVESTVLDMTGATGRLLRPGGVTVEQIEAMIGTLAAGQSDPVHRSPGMLASHYAPRLPLRLDARAVTPDEALLAFGCPLPGAALTFNLSPSSNLIEAASRLFSGLRWLDHIGTERRLTGIAAMPIPISGLGLAITDRLSRAAAPRQSVAATAGP